MKKYISLGCLLTVFNLFCSDYSFGYDYDYSGMDFSSMDEFLAESTPRQSDNSDDEFLAQSPLRTAADIFRAPTTMTIRKKLEQAHLNMPNFASNNPYFILGIDLFSVVGMNNDERKAYITKVYRQLAQIYHPDKNPDDSKSVAEEKFKKISEAYRKIKESNWSIG